jgi:hypothetical protein
LGSFIQTLAALKMKLLLLAFFGIALTFNSNGQIPKEFGYWFYNLPIIENPDKVFDVVSKDARFISKSAAIETANTYNFGEHTYWGRIVNVNLPDSLNKVDSSSVELTWGNMFNIEQRKSRKTYSGNLKILRIEYFTRDSLIINRLYDIVDKQLSQNFLQKGYIESGSKETTSWGTGIEIIYVNDKKHLQKLTILKNAYKNDNKSLVWNLISDKINCC